MAEDSGPARKLSAPSFELSSKISFARLKDSMKLRPSTHRVESVGHVVVPSDVQHSQLPQLNMPDFVPFDAAAAAADASPSPSTQPELSNTSTTTASSQLTRPSSSSVPDNFDGSQSKSLSPSSPNAMSATATMMDSSPAPAPTDGSPWIGGTGLGNTILGKSGRVIEKLMAENDRLRREMKAEITKREELQRAAQTQKPRLEALQAENARLSHCKAIDESVIVRRDRKIEDLKAELNVERQKRASLERRAQDAEHKMEEHEEHSNKEVQQAIEQAKHATTHATILETSHRQLSSEYRQRIATVNKHLKELNDEKEEDRKRLTRLDVVNHQMRQESEKTRKLYAEMLSVWDRFQEHKDSEVEKIREEVERLKQKDNVRETESQKTMDDMLETLNRMKWLMNVHKVTGEGVNSPPPSPHA